MHQTLSGRQFPCEICLVKLPDPERTLIRGSITDITGRKLLEEQLARRRRWRRWAGSPAASRTTSTTCSR
jgi:hypothetical protein